MEQAGVALIAQGASAYFSDMKTATSATNTFVDATDKGSGRVSAAGQVMIGGLRKVGEFVVDSFAQATKATAVFLKGSVDLAGDFQAGMNEFQVAAGKDIDTKGLEKFHDLFLQLGKDLPVSTSDVQQAAIELVKGGLDPATVAAGGLKQAIQFASAAMKGDLVGAAEISSKIVAGWADVNDTAADKANLLTHATDLLTKAANASSVDVHDLSLGLFNVQATAKSAGIGIDDVTTVLAELAGDFSSASIAGNSMASFITRLQPTTKDATEAMRGLGLYTDETGSAFYDARGNFVGFQQASQLLQDSLKGLTNEQKQSILQTIFQKDAIAVANGLAERGAQGYQNMAESLKNAMGVAEAGATKQQGYNVALDNMKGSIEAAQIVLATTFLPTLTDLLNNYITPGINVVSDFADTFFKMVPAIQASDDPLRTFLNALRVAAPQFLDVISGIEDFKDSVVGFIDAAKPFVPVVTGIAAGLASFAILTTVTGWISGTVAAVASLGAAMTAAGGGIAGVVALLGGPVTLAIAAVALAVGALTVAWQNNWGDIQGKTTAVVKALSDVWDNTLLPALKVVGVFLQDKVFPILSDLANVWLAVASVEVKALAALWTTILWPALKMVGDFMSGTVIPIFVALFQVNWAIATKAVEAMAGLWQKVLQPAFKTVSDYVTGTVVPALTSIGDYLNQTFGPTLASAKKWLSDITGGFAGVTGGVKDVVTWLGNLATSISNLKLPSWLTPGSPTPWEIALYGIGAALSTSVSPGLRDMQAGVQEIGAQISETFQNTDIIDMLTGIGEDAMAGFGKGLKAGLKGVLSIVNSTADSVEGAFKDAFDGWSPSKRMMPIGEDVTRGFLQGLADMWPSVTAFVSTMSDDLIDQVKDIGQQINGIIADSFGATASIDRQVAANLDKIKDVLPQDQINYQDQLNRAQKEAEKFLDPAEGAKYFQMRSKQILETAKLEKEASEARQAIADADQASADATAKQIEEIAKSDELRAQLAIAATDAEREAILKKLEASQKIQDAQIAARHEAEAARKEAQAMIPILEQQLLLINAAHQAELSQSNATPKSNPLQDLIDQFNQLFNNEKKAALEEQYAKAKTDAERERLRKEIEAAAIPINDTGLGHDLKALINKLAALWGVPGLASGGVARKGQPYWVGEHGPELFWPQMSGMVSPAASSQQMAARANTTNYNTTYNNTMPMYTNNSPGALQQSWAIMQASMP